MTSEPASPEQLSEVLRLATALADRALDAQIMGRPVPADQTVSLAKAARLLQDNDVDWPPLLMQVLHDLAPSIGQDDHFDAVPAEGNADGSPVIHGLTRLLSVFRRDKAQA